MSRAWPVVPGVPAAGHVTPGGAWHPGSDQSCPKAPCSRDYPAAMRSKFPEGGQGELYCPWCSATLVTLGLDPVKAAQAHAREQRHTGRPAQMNRALRLAAASRKEAGLG